jgi:hypothetical protein
MMAIARSIFVSIVAVGVVTTLSKASLGHGEAHKEHESHGKAEHKSHHEPKHEAHHEEHHDAHYNDHHGEHGKWNHDEHHGWHHDSHYDDHYARDEHRQFNHDDWYRHEWWHHQPSWHNRPWQHWWHCPTTNEIAAWSTGLGLATPAYYDYGPGGNVVYRNKEVYLNGTSVGTTDVYTNSVMALADGGPATNATNDRPDQWLPLGTFAVLRDDGDKKPSQTLQLALDKSGSVSGVLFDLQKDTSTPIRGSLDSATQRVAFDLGAKSGLVAETGIYNLTKDKVPLLVHQKNEKPQTYTLVRFQAPPAAAKEKNAAPLFDNPCNRKDRLMPIGRPIT